jgi:hypothetical protein
MAEMRQPMPRQISRGMPIRSSSVRSNAVMSTPDGSTARAAPCRASALAVYSTVSKPWLKRARLHDAR